MVINATWGLGAAIAQGEHQPIVLGIGTAEGGPIRTGPQSYATDAAGQRVFARLDVTKLNQLHDRTGAPVATVTADRRDVEWIERRVQSHLQARQADLNTRWKDEGWWLVIPLAVMAALEQEFSERPDYPARPPEA